MICKECGKALTGRQKYFCSNSCKSKPLGRKTGGWNNQRVRLDCLRCGKSYYKPPSQAKVSKYCSRLCQNRSQSDAMDRTGYNNPMWKGGIQTYRQYKKDKCERCGSTKHLLVHHKNRNRYDNKLDNLETLCKRCHQIEHEAGKNFPKGLEPWNKLKLVPCLVCSKPVKPLMRPYGRARFCSRSCHMKNRNATLKQHGVYPLLP